MGKVIPSKAVMVLSITLLLAACRVLGSNNDDYTTATEFIRAVANRDEVKAVSLLSSNAATAVIDDCPNRKLIACFDTAGMQNWGALKDILFELGDASTDEMTFSTLWTNNDPIAIVLVVRQENGKWVIDGWRGLIPTDKMEDLIDGTNTANQFPPAK